MENESPPPAESKTLVWTGRVLTALPAALLLFSTAMKFMAPPELIEGLEKFGYPRDLVLGLAITELVCTVLYLIPQTAVLGAILLTGYLGGATATHLRVGDSFMTPIIVGVVVWLGVTLRDRRLRQVLPWRR